MSRWITSMLTAALLSTAAMADNGAVEVVSETTDRVIQTVHDKRDHFRQHPDELRSEIREILGPHIDFIYSAQLILARHRHSLEREQIEQFADELSTLLLERYATALLDFDLRERIEILPLAGDNNERMTRVRTRVNLDNGNRAPIDYVLRKNDDGWQVFDVIVEGISYVTTFRNQIGEEIRRDGFDALMQRLQSGDLDLDVGTDES